MATTTLPAEQVAHSEIRGRKRDRWSRIFSQQVGPRLFLIAMSMLFLLPLYWMVATSLKGDAELASYPPTLFPQDMRWSNYPDAVRAFTDDSAGVTFLTYVKNTGLITGLTVLGAVISNPLIGYGFARIDWPGRDKVFFLVLATIFVPQAAIMVAMFDIWVNIGELFGIRTINTYWPLVLPAFFGNATWIFLMRQFYRQIPREMSDAAKLDGASEFQVFSQIIMPQAKAAVGAIGIFAAVGAWNDFMGPLIYLNSPDRYTLALGLQSLESNFQELGTQWSLLLTASVIFTIPMIVIFFLFQRYFMEGLTHTGIKG